VTKALESPQFLAALCGTAAASAVAFLAVRLSDESERQLQVKRAWLNLYNGTYRFLVSHVLHAGPRQRASAFFVLHAYVQRNLLHQKRAAAASTVAGALLAMQLWWTSPYVLYYVWCYVVCMRQPGACVVDCIVAVVFSHALCYSTCLYLAQITGLLLSSEHH
jgi:hypothetical protein